MSHGLVIPTRGDHEDLLDAVITHSGLDADRVIVVSNTAGYDHDRATVLCDTGPINIQHWWNLGIHALASLGCTIAVVLNDDIVIESGRLDDLVDALHDSGATLAHPGQPGQHTGHAWALNLAHDVRPDETYRWWYGDDQLYLDASRAHGITAVPSLTITHLHHNASTNASAELQALAAEDQRTWLARR